jgi:hypothetical protein
MKPESVVSGSRIETGQIRSFQAFMNRNSERFPAGSA